MPLEKIQPVSFWRFFLETRRGTKNRLEKNRDDSAHHEYFWFLIHKFKTRQQSEFGLLTYINILLLLCRNLHWFVLDEILIIFVECRYCEYFFFFINKTQQSVLPTVENVGLFPYMQIFQQFLRLVLSFSLFLNFFSNLSFFYLYLSPSQSCLTLFTIAHNIVHCTDIDIIHTY